MDLNFGWLIGVVIMIFLTLVVWARVSDQTIMEVIKDIINQIRGE
jgi:sensor domain CHASE-containing protein